MNLNLTTYPLFSDDCTGKDNPCQECHSSKDRMYYSCDGGDKAAKRKCKSGHKCVKTGNCQIKCEKIIKATTTTTGPATTITSTNTTSPTTLTTPTTGGTGKTILKYYQGALFSCLTALLLFS